MLAATTVVHKRRDRVEFSTVTRSPSAVIGFLSPWEVVRVVGIHGSLLSYTFGFIMGQGILAVTGRNGCAVMFCVAICCNPHCSRLMRVFIDCLLAIIFEFSGMTRGMWDRVYYTGGVRLPLSSTNITLKRFQISGICNQLTSPPLVWICPNVSSYVP
jgi:hypothetical protein